MYIVSVLVEHPVQSLDMTFDYCAEVSAQKERKAFDIKEADLFFKKMILKTNENARKLNYIIDFFNIKYIIYIKYFQK